MQLGVNMAYYVVMSTIDSPDRAGAFARTLLGARLVACVNIIGPITSLYRWQGKIADDEEYLLLMKTEATEISTLIERIQALHPYEVPEIMALPIVDGASAYLSWIHGSIRQQEM
jgi:periplasmic divalent cation tolerance protein